jgi:gliding motility-associated-like protein
MRISILTYFLISIYSNIVQAQQIEPYILNGNATKRTCNCYVLTEAVNNQSGTVWNRNQVNLNQSFDYTFEINMGCKDADGADGIGFILQTRGTNLGAQGGGLGFDGISPSLGVLIDTWMNDNNQDPNYDHISIHQNGNLNHGSSDELAAAVRVIEGQDNIEDCNWHLFRIVWDPNALQMDVYIDHQLRRSIQKDIVNDIFGGNPLVYWGFAGSTGGSNNKQQFCAALKPDFKVGEQQKMCVGEPIQFEDFSSSFGSITRRYWDLGDGTIIENELPGLHTYTLPGIYPIKMIIEDNSGCSSDTLIREVIVGSIPEPAFEAQNLCDGSPIHLVDQTTLMVGSIRQINWEVNAISQSHLTEFISSQLTPGTYPVTMEVLSEQGCYGKRASHITVSPTPIIQAMVDDVCLGEANIFSGISLRPEASIQQWEWMLNGSTLSNLAQFQHMHTEGGRFSVHVRAKSNQSCWSSEAIIPYEVFALNLQLISDSIVAFHQPVQLEAQATGSNLSYYWTPAQGLDNPNISNPIATIERDQTYTLIVTSPQGCAETKSIHLNGFRGPAIYVPTAFSPNQDGQNDVFKAFAPGLQTLHGFQVWDRWGQLVFQTKDIRQGWDGRFKEHGAPAGTYVWIVRGVDYRGNPLEKKGTVTLIR